MTDERNHSAEPEDPAIGRLYRATRKEEPSAELDAKILAEAERVSRRRRRSWLLPLSTAAVVLLGVSFTIKLMEQTPRLPESTGQFDVGRPKPAEEAQAPVPQRKKSQALQAPTQRLESMSRTATQTRIGGQKAMPKHLPAPSSFDNGMQLDELKLPGTDLEDSVKPDMFDLAEDWLKRIQALLDAGDTAGAIRELRAFTTAYPEYPLPERLQGLLPRRP